MSKLKFYWMYSPLAKKEAEKIKGNPLEEQLEYLKSRLKTIKYKDFGHEDPMQSPDVMFAVGNGDCEDRVGFVATVFRMARVPHTIYIGKVNTQPNVLHTWIEVGPYIFETTEPSYFLKGTEKIKYYPLQYIYCDRKGELTYG